MWVPFPSPGPFFVTRAPACLLFPPPGPSGQPCAAVNGGHVHWVLMAAVRTISSHYRHIGLPLPAKSPCVLMEAS